MKNRNDKYKKLYAMLNELGIKHRKEDLLAGYGVESAKELTDEELTELITRLEGMKKHKCVTSEITRKLRSEILTLLTKLGIYNDNNDWHKVNEYMKDKRIAGKYMYECTDAELKALTVKLRAILVKHLDDVKKKTILTILN